MSGPTTRRRSNKEGIQASVVEAAKRQISTAGCVAQDAVVSGTWVYPILGAIYLVSHPSLLRPLLPSLIKGGLLSVAVVAALFLFTYLPQVAALAFVSGPLAFVAAVPLVLGEAYLVVNFLARPFIFGQAGVDLFDAVLVQKGHTALVERGRQVTSKPGKAKVLGTLVSKPLSRFSTDNAVRYVLSLPLNFVPVVGPVFFLGYNGFKAGPGYHARYFQLKGYDKDKRHSVISARRGAYTAFGTVATALNLVPVVSILFNFTSTVGAALWAADMESKTGPRSVRETMESSKVGGSADSVEVSMSSGKKEL